MAVRNGEAFIGRALQSIASSSDACGIEYEVLLADGGSRDKTREIAASNPKVKIISTSDSGVYDGMNRAIACARGDYVAIVNGDDELMADGLREALRLLRADTSLGVIAGPAAFGAEPNTATSVIADQSLTIQGVLFAIPAINARLYRRGVFERVGPIKTDIGFGADREFLLRLMGSSVRRAASQDRAPLYFYRVHPASTTIAHDTSSRQRVYQSDLALAAYLLRGVSTGELAVQTRAFRALTKLKILRFHGLRMWYDSEFGEPGPRTVKERIAARTVDVARGVIANKRWRGRLAGW